LTILLIVTIAAKLFAADLTNSSSQNLTAPSVADARIYLADISAELEKLWPTNRTVNIVCHGHSVPAGYFKTPTVDSLDAYPAQLRNALAKRFPHAVINVIVTAIGGENAVQGAARFDHDVLTHRPDVVFIDYSLNDRRVGLELAREAWISMIKKARSTGVKVILLTPTPDQSAKLDDPEDPLNQHARQVRELAAEFHVGLVDSLAAFKAEIARGVPLADLMAQGNHPNARGHKLVADELLKWFPAHEKISP
jgi:lysophospholipase L1-like esterase